MVQDGLTNKELILRLEERLESLHERADAIYTQTKLTNGRVNTIEPLVDKHTKQITSIHMKMAYFAGAVAIAVLIIELLANTGVLF